VTFLGNEGAQGTSLVDYYLASPLTLASMTNMIGCRSCDSGAWATAGSPPVPLVVAGPKPTEGCGSLGVETCPAVPLCDGSQIRVPACSPHGATGVQEAAVPGPGAQASEGATAFLASLQATLRGASPSVSGRPHFPLQTAV
jgi:hypothetical protein